MKYMLLINAPHGTGDYQHPEWPADRWAAHMDYWQRLNSDLKEAGEMVEVRALAAPGTTRIVRAGANGLPAMTDGPFPEAKEFLAGYWIVDVDGPERAYEIAARASAVPGPDGAPMMMPIEVRQVMSAPPVDA